MGIGNQLKNFDVYRKLPQDLTEPTLSGALISIISTLIMVILFISEFSAFLDVSEASEMYVDYARSEQKLQVNIDIEFTRLPCEILSVDAQDVMGSHHVNLEGDLIKYRLDADQNVLERVESVTTDLPPEHQGHAHVHGSPTIDFEKLKQSFTSDEGCQIRGYIYVNKVPGNFHISSHAVGNQISKILQTGGLRTLDLSHKINHLSFGHDRDIKQIKRKFQNGVLSPLDGTSKIKPANQKDISILHQYYVSIVPSIFEDLRGRAYSVFQFTSNNNELQSNHLPAVYFRYDLSPVTVKFKQHRESFFHFLVQVCAIIGGVFTVAGIIDGMVHRSVVALLKKHQMGKLS